MKINKCEKKTGRADAGFTLVELIVVIAILAILGGVAVPAYNGYVKKANMTADRTLVSEVAKAMELAYYSGLFGDEFVGGSVTLSLDGTATGDPALAAAMEKSFGSEWEDLQLKYDGWTNTQADAVVKLNASSFSDGNGGVKQGLLGTVDTLAGTLSDLMQQPTFTIGNYGSFADYLTENGIDYSSEPQKAANSVVPYLSDATAGADRDKIKESLSTTDSWIVTDDAGNTKLSMTSALGSTIADTGTQPFPTLAATYATMKGFCEWADNANGTNLSEQFNQIPLYEYRDEENHTQTVTNEMDVVKAIEQALESQGYASQMVPLFEQYISSGAAAKDVDAYFGVIDSIADNRDYIMGNLDNSENFYSNRTGYLNAYLNVSVNPGDIAVIVTLGPNGVLEIGAVGMGTEA